MRIPAAVIQELERISKPFLEEWELEEPLIRKVTQYPPVRELKKYVVDYWDRDADWDLNTLRGWLPNDVLMLLSTVSLAGAGDRKDHIRWKPSTKGNFVTRSAYDILRGFDDLPNDPSWRRLWKFKGPSRTSLFL
ncbi:hypothetical protein M9H77_34465 [Catharanthus roseus]|uniref:Uncharacterized protein n=1 Tax=Catharanthus roseus TaxID=4058 RepID=A0ACB9ZPV6_CATRO|nr:hypothetical protein M9H77_34465 [Catharanthus roseus]